MFDGLRRQFIVTVMLIISIILVLSFVAIYISAAASLSRRFDAPASTVQMDVQDGLMHYLQQQRDDYARRAMGELLATLVLAGIITLTAVYFLSRHIAERAIGPIEEAYEKQRQFVADASHELKTPITIIGANIDAAIADSERPSKWLKNIRREVDHSGRLVSDLLMLAKFDAEQLPADHKRFDLAKVCDELAEQFNLLAKEKSLTLTRQLDGPLYVMSDEEKVRQVLTVLLDNAIRHTPDDGQIQLSAQRKKDNIEIVVENTHPTIPADKLSHLFERFYQVDDSHADKGTGLGLAIARKIARHMKWKLEAASADDMVTFTLTISR